MDLNFCQLFLLLNCVELEWMFIPLILSDKRPGFFCCI